MVHVPARASAVVRSAVAFLLLPGVVGFAIPVALLIARGEPRAHWTPLIGLGLLVGLAGTAGLLWCARAFHTVGNGTLAPWDPARTLVRIGLYSVSRNPMYICVLLILAGWALGFASWTSGRVRGLRRGGVPRPRGARRGTHPRPHIRRRVGQLPLVRFRDGWDGCGRIPECSVTS